MFMLFADAVVQHGAEVATKIATENRALDWPLAAVLMTLIGTVGAAAIASLRVKHSLNRDVSNSGKTATKTNK